MGGLALSPAEEADCADVARSPRTNPTLVRPPLGRFGDLIPAHGRDPSSGFAARSWRRSPTGFRGGVGNTRPEGLQLPTPRPPWPGSDGPVRGVLPEGNWLPDLALVPALGFRLSRREPGFPKEFPVPGPERLGHQQGEPAVCIGTLARTVPGLASRSKRPRRPGPQAGLLSGSASGAPTLARTG